MIFRQFFSSPILFIVVELNESELYFMKWQRFHNKSKDFQGNGHTNVKIADGCVSFLRRAQKCATQYNFS